MNDLLPCPFCGDSAILGGLGGFHEVECTNCNAITNYTKSEAEAVALWNQRVDAARDGAVAAERSAARSEHHSAGRDSVLEEAAKLCDEAAEDCSIGSAGQEARHIIEELAAAIRALSLPSRDGK
jgi:Lar family restriction alleviation protein